MLLVNNEVTVQWSEKNIQEVSHFDVIALQNKKIMQIHFLSFSHGLG